MRIVLKSLIGVAAAGAVLSASAATVTPIAIPVTGGSLLSPVTGLLSTLSAPLGGGLTTLPGASSLTGLLGGSTTSGLPGLSSLTGLLSGGLTSLPGASSLTGLPGASVLTDLLGSLTLGGLPGLPSGSGSGLPGFSSLTDLLTGLASGQVPGLPAPLYGLLAGLPTFPVLPPIIAPLSNVVASLPLSALNSGSTELGNTLGLTNSTSGGGLLYNLSYGGLTNLPTVLLGAIPGSSMFPSLPLSLFSSYLPGIPALPTLTSLAAAGYPLVSPLVAELVLFNGTQFEAAPQQLFNYLEGQSLNPTLFNGLSPTALTTLLSSLSNYLPASSLPTLP